MNDCPTFTYGTFEPEKKSQVGPVIIWSGGGGGGRAKPQPCYNSPNGCPLEFLEINNFPLKEGLYQVRSCK